ncbi:ArsR/SmtB family transcription factor [Ancylobacter terrae]|uniref:ArsR/SmtB family transcription factor n=1 Tax=Ancylobacter sp. sgz301288 TaxID=3342077 RepID=UPI00385C740D
MNCKPPPQQSVPTIEDIAAKSEQVASFLKGLANPHRLQILCLLAAGPRSVGELIEATGIGQTSMSQHLARLKDEGIVDFERRHRTLSYRIAHPAVADIMDALYNHFCRKE